MVSVINLDNPYKRTESIKRFTAEINKFDIKSDQPSMLRLFETHNGLLESQYHNILTDLNNNGTLSDKSYTYLIQLIANLMARSDFWRNQIFDVMNSSGKEIFLQFIMQHICQGIDDLKTLKEKPFFRVLADNPLDDGVINRVLIYFQNYIKERIQHFEIAIIQSQGKKHWWTSTNPVAVINGVKGIEILHKESELYFPLSPQYLIYLHHRNSDDQSNDLRKLNTNQIHLATDKENTDLQNIILANHTDYVIVSGEHIYNRELYNRKHQSSKGRKNSV